MLVEPYCCLFEGVDSRFRGNDRRQVLKDAKLQPKPPKKSTYNRDGHPSEMPDNLFAFCKVIRYNKVFKYIFPDKNDVNKQSKGLSGDVNIFADDGVQISNRYEIPISSLKPQSGRR